MSNFESHVIWRFVAPLAVACVIAVGGNFLAVVRVSAVVDQLEKTRQNMATKTWVQGRMDVFEYRIGTMEDAIDANNGRIIRNREMIDELQRSTDTSAIWHPPLKWRDQGSGRTYYVTARSATDAVTRQQQKVSFLPVIETAARGNLAP